eukprot:TRINITY_DN22182_c0_g1_i1.p1 TRINITY_DN22182_c0_g1~~TRINITY_DN22182_c0_g1_i1.p1  ORF type:complete len:371 (+),score=140.05 TRINITY_DN22182_c0_g1_i1:71-1183(+)
MGGDAVKVGGVSVCRRVLPDVYAKVKEYVLQKVAAVHRAEVVVELPGKESFGDLDLLTVVPEGGWKTIRPWAREAFGVPEEHVAGSKVVSIAFDCSAVGHDGYFQVDFIPVENVARLNMARLYFSYGDLGAIIGRITNHYGLKFGDPGLWCEVFEQTADPAAAFDVRKTLGSVHLSTSPEDICDYLGLDFAVWRDVFPTLASAADHPAIFDWLVSSPWFDPAIFKRGNGNHRRRQLMRPFYTSFLAHVGVEDAPVECAEWTEGETGGGTHNRQLHAVDHFGKRAEYDAVVMKHRVEAARKAKFTGGDVHRAYEAAGKKLKGREVGAAIDEFKKFAAAAAGASFEAYLDSEATRDDVVALVETHVAQQLAS